MDDRAAFFGTYADIKNIRSRKVAQIIVEIPIERYAEFVSVFGGPNPAEETCIALARMDGETPVKDTPKKRSFYELSPTQQAVLACKRDTFQLFIAEQDSNGLVMDIMDEENTADYVRNWCGVESRSELTTDLEAGTRWTALYDQFQLWLADAA